MRTQNEKDEESFWFINQIVGIVDNPEIKGESIMLMSSGLEVPFPHPAKKVAESVATLCKRAQEEERLGPSKIMMPTGFGMKN